MPQHDQVSGGKVNTSRRHQIGSPVSVTALLTLLGLRRLVSPHASEEMLYLLRRKKHSWKSTVIKTEETTWSPLLDNITRSVRRFSKLGLVGNSVGDGVYAERKSDAGKPIKYAATLIDYPNPLSLKDPNFDTEPTLVALAQGIDQAIEENNP